MTKWQKDTLERVLWTAAQGVIAMVIVAVASLDVAWGPPIMAALATAKAGIAVKIGDPDSAATWPVASPR